MAEQHVLPECPRCSATEYQTFDYVIMGGKCSAGHRVSFDSESFRFYCPDFPETLPRWSEDGV